MLTYEIVKRIFFDLGAEEESFGKFGLTIPELQLPDKLQGTYEDTGEAFAYPIFGGQLEIEKEIFRCVLSNLSSEYSEDYYACFHISSGLHYGIIISIPKVKEVEPLVKFVNINNNSVIDTSILWQSKLLSGFETIVSFGLLWKKISDKKDLIDNLHLLLS